MNWKEYDESDCGIIWGTILVHVWTAEENYEKLYWETFWFPKYKPGVLTTRPCCLVSSNWNAAKYYTK
jgi:hypothetical protein